MFAVDVQLVDLDDVRVPQQPQVLELRDELLSEAYQRDDLFVPRADDLHSELFLAGDLHAAPHDARSAFAELVLLFELLPKASADVVDGWQVRALVADAHEAIFFDVETQSELRLGVKHHCVSRGYVSRARS